MAMFLTFLRLVWARFRGRPLDLEIGGRRIHLFPDGRILPGIAGADGAGESEGEGAGEGEGDPAKPDPTPKPTAPESETKPEGEGEPKPEISDAGKAAIKAERDAAKAAQKAAREAQVAAARALGVENPEQLSSDKIAEAIKEKERARLSDEERLKQDAAEGKRLATEAQQKLRRANLLTELNKPEHKLVSAQAAVKLIEGVEFDTDEQPTNLADRMEALVAEHPFLVKGNTPTPDSAPPGNPESKRRKKEAPSMNDLLRRRK